MTKQKFGLTGTALKTIALVLMVMDHIHYFFEFTGVVPEWFSMLARLSAPLFLFCTVEGFAHTHDRRRYFLRIWAIGTAMGTVEFFMLYAGAFRRGDGFYPMNAIFQDLMLLCIIWQGIDWLRQRRFVRGALAAAMPILWPICIVALLMLFPKIQDAPIGSSVLAWVITAPLPLWTSITDGGWSFLAGGIALYALYNHKRLRLVVWAAMTFLCDFVLVFLQVRGLPDFAFPRCSQSTMSGSAFLPLSAWRCTTASAAAATSSCSTGSTRHMSTCFTVHPVLFTAYCNKRGYYGKHSGNR